MAPPGWGRGTTPIPPQQSLPDLQKGLRGPARGPCPLERRLQAWLRYAAMESLPGLEPPRVCSCGASGWGAEETVGGRGGRAWSRSVVSTGQGHLSARHTRSSATMFSQVRSTSLHYPTSSPLVFSARSAGRFKNINTHHRQNEEHCINVYF